MTEPRRVFAIPRVPTFEGLLPELTVDRTLPGALIVLAYGSQLPKAMEFGIVTRKMEMWKNDPVPSFEVLWSDGRRVIHDDFQHEFRIGRQFFLIAPAPEETRRDHVAF